MFSDYNVINLRHRSDRETCHQIFVKQYSDRNAKELQLPIGKTLLAAQIPPYVQKQDLIFGFKDIGEISEIIFPDVNTTSINNANSSATASNVIGTNISKYFKRIKYPFKFKTAFIIFKLQSSLKKALEINEINLFENNRTVLRTGLTKWMTEYMNDIPDKDELEMEVENYLNIFDEAIDADTKNSQKNIDAGGWTVVGKGKRAAGGAGSFQQNEQLLNELEQKLEARNKKKQLTNFYTFQTRETKQKKIIGMRKRFEEDKRRIELMKKTRKFKTLG